MSNQRKTENPMGASKKQALRVTFDSCLKLEFHGAKVTSDAGLLAYRELDAALGLTDLGENLLNDWRTGKNTQHTMARSCGSPSSVGWLDTRTPMTPNGSRLIPPCDM
jgi:hypothetical protein